MSESYYSKPPEPFAHVVIDLTGDIDFGCVGFHARESCHEHINDCLSEQIEGARGMVVRPVYSEADMKLLRGQRNDLAMLAGRMAYAIRKGDEEQRIQLAQRAIEYIKRNQLTNVLRTMKASS